MLSRTGRSCALMCDRTPDNARQEMLHARPRRDSLQVRPRRLRLQLGLRQRLRVPAQWRLLHDAEASCKPHRTSKQSKGRRGRHARVTRARHRVGTDACRSVHVHTYKKKYSVHELLRRGALAHARARDLLVCVWRGATRVASDACSRLDCLRVRMAARIRWLVQACESFS